MSEREVFMEDKRRGPLPPVLFLAALLLQWAAHTFVPVMPLIPSAWAALGTIPIVVGLVVMVVADRQFKAASTAIKPFDTPSSLVQSGPFHFSRNPMYLGMVLILIGAAVVWGSLSPFLLPPIMVWLLTARFIAAEEVSMSEAFGADYELYKSRVRRWL